MNQDEKEALSGAGTPERAVETGTACETASASISDFSTPNGSGQMSITAFLLRGVENAINLRHLVYLTGMNSRDLRRRIQEERLTGVPILSDNASGYFLPANDEERRRFVRSMRSRAREILAVADAVERVDLPF